MDEKALDQLQSKNKEVVKLVLESFNAKYANLFDFTEFNIDTQWLAIWKGIFSNLRDPQMVSIYPICLNSVRILTRDENSIRTNNILDEFNCLLKLATLASPEKITASSSSTGCCGDQPFSYEIIMEALKCLCNIVFLSAECRRLCVRNVTMDGILKRVSSPTMFPCEIEFFDMKLLFLITALEPSARSKVQIDLNGLAYLTEWLHVKIMSTDKSDQQIDLICEILKVMFNVTSNPDKSPNENEIQNRHLTAVIRSLLFEFGMMATDREQNVVTNSINLLTNISSSCLSELLVKYDAKATVSTDPVNTGDYEFEGSNIRALDILLRYLKLVLGDKEKWPTASEHIPPVLTVLVKCARCNSTMRHYIRQVVLPPLKDVSKRPEVGTELRNHLCRFLTIPEMIIRDLSSELLFVCCKENVSRMIKYTGYGNAAGLFASRGVLDCRHIENTEYSSDSEDSDTEEYKEMQHGINPVLGCYEAPKKDPLEGMSDEQKEYEAMELVNLMDKLHKSGVVQPCRIGEDGKPKPVDHILQLQEELPQQQFEQKRKT